MELTFVDDVRESELSLVLFLALTLLSGWLVVYPIRLTRKSSELFWFKFFVSVPLGIAISSVACFSGLITAGQITAFALPILLAFCLLIRLFCHKTAVIELNSSPAFVASQTRIINMVFLTLVVSLAISAIFTFIVQTTIHPHGGWDAQMIWNLHARFLYLGAAHWSNGFSSLSFWTKPDYPLLLPIFIAEIWSLIKFDSSVVSAVVAFAFAVCGAGVLYFGLLLTSNRGSANVALLTLLVSPYFCRLGYSQLADVPIAFYLLSATVFLTLADKGNKKGFMFLLVGLNLSAAIWTKNDGAIFSVALVLARALFLFKRPAQIAREALPTALGAGPMMIAAAIWKIVYAPPNERLAGQSLSIVLSNLLNFSRHVEVFKSFVLELVYFAGWALPMSPLFVIYKLCMVRPLTRQERLSDNTIGVALTTTVIAYYTIFMLSPTQLDFDLATTLPRLLMQIYPTFLYWLFFSSIDIEKIDFWSALLSFKKAPTQH